MALYRNFSCDQRLRDLLFNHIKQQLQQSRRATHTAASQTLTALCNIKALKNELEVQQLWDLLLAIADMKQDPWQPMAKAYVTRLDQQHTQVQWQEMNDKAIIEALDQAVHDVSTSADKTSVEDDDTSFIRDFFATITEPSMQADHTYSQQPLPPSPASVASGLPSPAPVVVSECLADQQDSTAVSQPNVSPITSPLSSLDRVIPANKPQAEANGRDRLATEWHNYVLQGCSESDQAEFSIKPEEVIKQRNQLTLSTKNHSQVIVTHEARSAQVKVALANVQSSMPLQGKIDLAARMATVAFFNQMLESEIANIDSHAVSIQSENKAFEKALTAAMTQYIQQVRQKLSAATASQPPVLDQRAWEASMTCASPRDRPRTCG